MTAMLAAPPAFDTRRSAAARAGQMRGSGNFGPHLAVQRDGAGTDRDAATGLIRRVVSSPGQPLDPGVRSVMETGLGHDFSHVRVHTDEDAARSADAIGANAYTAGNHIVFGAGRFMPAAPDGQRVVAHELAHVIQQARGPVAGMDVGDGVTISHPQDPFERDAVRLAERAMTTPPSVESKSGALARASDRNSGATPLAIQRQQTPQEGPFTKAGAWAGALGALFGLGALVVALYAWLKPKNQNATGQGVTMTPSNPFLLPTTPPPLPAEGAKPDEKTKYQSAVEAAPTVTKVLELQTDDANDQIFELQRKSDGTHIISGMITAGDHKGYIGGYNGSIASVNFSSMQSAVAPKATKPPAKAPPASTRKGSGSTASSEAPTPSMERWVIDFTGMNGKADDPQLQKFNGQLLLTGNGTVRCERCDVTNNIGRAQNKGTYGLVDYRTPTPVSGANLSAPTATAPSASGSPAAEKQPPSNPPNAGAGR